MQTALERGARLGLARADTAVANAAIIAARALPESVRHGELQQSRRRRYHFSFDVPIDLPSLRDLRIRSARDRACRRPICVITSRARPSRSTPTRPTRMPSPRASTSRSRGATRSTPTVCLHMVERRRDAGDASDMDVELARSRRGAADQHSPRPTRSRTLSTVLDLQAVLGHDHAGPRRRADRFADRAAGGAPRRRKRLSEAAAGLSVESATLAARLQHRSILSLPSLSLGFETGDPTDAEPGILPTFGIGLALPLFDRNRGAIAQAEAERARAVAELTLARVEARNQINHATRERAAALARVARDRQLVASATRVASMSLTAYREGASSLPNVLEAQRTARDVLGQYIDDLAAAWIATAELRVLATPSPATPNHETTTS